MARGSLRRMRGWRRWVCYSIIAVYGIVPAMALLFPGLVAYIAFSFSLPSFFDNLQDPSASGLEAARHVALTTDTGHTLGLWHILPESALEEKDGIQDQKFEARLASGNPIFIYAHGSGGSRSQFTRVHTYTALRGQEFHVVTFDYRGFGDSTGEATEGGMVEDLVAVFRWVKTLAWKSPVFLWGHSMGAGVVTQAARNLSTKDELPDGIVLEGAFNNLHDMLEVAFIMLPYRPFPFLMRIFQDALKSQSATFASDQHLIHVRCPTLMLHAEDDKIVPIDLGRKLFQSVVSAKKKDQAKITMHVFPADKGYGHNRLNQAPDLGSVIQQFVQESQKEEES